MARKRSGYSRLVRALSFGFPLIALALIAALFLFSKRIDYAAPSVITGVDIGQLIAQGGIGEPNYTGKLANGALLRLSAQRITSIIGAQSEISATELAIEIQESAGRTLTITAPTGRIPPNGLSLVLAGGVEIADTGGLFVQASDVNIALDMSSIEASGGVQAGGLFGDFSAGSMALVRQTSENGATGYQSVFKDGVRLLYLP